MSAEQPPPVEVRKTTTSEKYFLRFSRGCAWALFVIDEEDHSLFIASDYGNWTHYWPRNIGPKSFKEFLIGLARPRDDYLLGKLSAGKKEFCWDKTMADLKDMILRNRRDGTFKKAKARKLWDELRELEGNPTRSDVEFKELVDDYATGIRDHYYQISESPVSRDYNYQLKRFVREVYPHFANVLRKEVSDATVQDRNSSQQ